MPESIDGKIRLIIETADSGNSSGASSGGSGSAGGSSAPAGSRTAKKETRELKFYDNVERSFKGVVGAMTAGGVLTLMARYSKTSGAVLESILELFGAVIDTFLIPFMPLFTKILSSLAPLIPVLMELFDDLITPIVNVLLPIITRILDNISKLFTAFNDLAEAIRHPGKTIGTAIRQMTNPTEGEQAETAAIDSKRAELINAYEQAFSFWQRLFGRAKLPEAYFSGNMTEMQKIIDEYNKIITGKSKQLGGLIPSTGMYYLHRGEEVVHSQDSQKQELNFYNDIKVNVDGSTNLDTVGKMLAASVTEQLTTAARSGVVAYG